MTKKPPATYPVSFSWLLFRPDNRQYRQNSSELSPSDALEVTVDIPLNGEHFANSEEIIQAQISAGSSPIPELTVKGMKAIHDAFSEFFEDFDPLDVSTEFDAITTPDDGWDVSSPQTKEETDDWDDEPKAEKETPAEETDPDWESVDDDFATDNSDDSWDDATDDWD